MRYFSAVVIDNQDPDEQGKLQLLIPLLSGDTEPHPDWIRGRVTAGAAPGAGFWFVPPVDTIVVVEADAGGELRWTGGAWGEVNAPPAALVDNYPRRAGFTSPEGVHALALDDDDGLHVLIGPDGSVEVLIQDGPSIALSSAGATILGDAITLTNAPAAPLQPLVKGTAFAAALAAALPELAAAATALGIYTPQTSALISGLGSGAYLSTVTKTA